jgi:hypothetical protein
MYMVLNWSIMKNHKQDAVACALTTSTQEAEMKGLQFQARQS